MEPIEPTGLLEQPETLSDYEQERGKPMPSKNHSYIELNVGAELRQRYRKTHSFYTELSLQLGDLPVTPDVCVFPKQKIDFASDLIKVTEPPLVAIEILSPSQSQQPVADEIYAMLAAGVIACWLVQPALQIVSVFLPAQKPKTFTEGIVRDGVTGIELSLDEIFSTE